MTDRTTVAAVKLYCGITDSTDDTLLSSLITAYSQWVRSYCNRDFDSRAYEIWRDGRHSQNLLLPEYPVTAIALLEIDGIAISPQTTYDGEGYRFTDSQIILGQGQRFCWGRQNIHVQFTAGYATIPTDVAQAVNEIVGLRYANHDSDKQGWTSQNLAGQVVSLNIRDMPASAQTVLNQYARRKVPI